MKGHKKVEREVNELVGRTNSEFSSLDYMPVCFLNQTIGLTELCALYSVADALLVTSLRGGLGSVVSVSVLFLSCVCYSNRLTSIISKAQEYIVCQRERHGVLILSEFVGVSVSLSVPPS